MAKTTPETTYVGTYRDAHIQNIDNLGNKRRDIEAQISTLEQNHRDAVRQREDFLHEEVDELKRLAKGDIASMERALADSLRPLEEALRDVTVTIYSQERAIGALPSSPSTFSPHVESDSADGKEDAPGEKLADTGAGVADTQNASVN